MASTIEVLETEADRLESLARRMREMAAELRGKPAQPTKAGSRTREAKYIATPTGKKPITNGHGSLEGLTQKDAVLRVLKDHGPQTTREIFNRMNEGGFHFPKPVYVAAICFRMKDKVERGPDGKLKLKG